MAWITDITRTLSSLVQGGHVATTDESVSAEATEDAVVDEAATLEADDPSLVPEEEELTAEEQAELEAQRRQAEIEQAQIETEKHKIKMAAAGLIPFDMCDMKMAELGGVNAACGTNVEQAQQRLTRLTERDEDMLLV